MTELIKVAEYKGKQMVNARELHFFLESKQDFSTWIKNRIEKYGFAKDQDFISFHKKMERAVGATTRIEYALTLTMAKELCMVENNDKGQQARRYFIDVERKFKSFHINPASLSKLDILKMAIEIEESRLKLEAENKNLKPKAELAERIIETDDLIDVGQVAKVLDLPFGRNTMFKELRARGVFFKNRNEPMQQYINRGYFKLKEKLIERENHENFTVIKVLVTQKGLLFLSKLFKVEIPNHQTTKIAS